MSTIDDKRRRPSLAEQVGEEVRRLRKQIGLRQETLADRAGISRQHLSKIETGKVDVSVSVLAALATVMGRTLGELLEDVDLG